MNTIRIVAATLFLVGMTGQAMAETETKTAAETSAEGERIKCKRLSVTGSLTQGTKVCKTVREWREMRERNSDFARDMRDTLTARQGGQ